MRAVFVGLMVAVALVTTIAMLSVRPDALAHEPLLGLFVLGALALAAAGLWAVDRMLAGSQVEDPPQIVIDEVNSLERRVRAFSQFAAEPPGISATHRDAGGDEAVRDGIACQQTLDLIDIAAGDGADGPQPRGDGHRGSDVTKW